MQPLEYRAPASAEEEAMVEDMKREERLLMALSVPAFREDQDPQQDSRRYRKVLERETDACRVRLTHLRSQVRYRLGSN